MSFYIRKRVKKTLERLKFKANNPDSYIYGFFPHVKQYSTHFNDTYEIDKFKIIEEKNKIMFYYNHHLQVVIHKFLITTVISQPIVIHKILDEIDLLTNNDTR